MQQIQTYTPNDINFDRQWIEQILLQIGDAFDIRILWNSDTVFLTGALAVAGGLFGGYAGGRMGAAVGAGIGSVTGLVVSAFVSLREIWGVIKDQLQELPYIIFNYLRRLDVSDYALAYHTIMACASSRRVLVLTILDFIAEKLGRHVLSNITAA